nr:unnamed protein product [Spirometra erinaceieuropaei]
MLRQLHDGSMMERVTENEVVSESFAMTNGVKQDCILFSRMFSAMMMDAYRANVPRSALPTGRKANSSILGEYAFSRVYSQLSLTSFYFGQLCSRSAKNRRQSGPPHCQGQPSLRPSTKHSLESTQYTHQNQIAGVQSGHPADAASWSGDLNGVQEAGAQSQSLPPQLSSTNIKAEVAGLDPGHGRTGTDRNP